MTQQKRRVYAMLINDLLMARKEDTVRDFLRKDHELLSVFGENPETLTRIEITNQIIETYYE